MTYNRNIPQPVRYTGPTMYQWNECYTTEHIMMHFLACPPAPPATTSTPEHTRGNNSSVLDALSDEALWQCRGSNVICTDTRKSIWHNATNGGVSMRYVFWLAVACVEDSSACWICIVRPYPMMVLKTLIYARMMFCSYARWPPSTTRSGSVRRKCDWAKVTRSLFNLGGVVNTIPG